MAVKVFFIHTVSNLYTMFSELSGKYIKDVRTYHISDDSLIKDALEAGGLTASLTERLCRHVVTAEKGGADVIQVTCSSMSPAVKEAQKLVKVPVLTVDEPVAKHITGIYSKIGVIATAVSTLKPSTEMVRNAAAGKNVKIESVLCEGAYEALFKGDTETHDAIVIRYLKELMNKVDAVLLAQVSMARVANSLPESEKKVPLFTSPEYAMKELACVVNNLK